MLYSVSRCSGAPTHLPWNNPILNRRSFWLKREAVAAADPEAARAAGLAEEWAAADLAWAAANRAVEVQAVRDQG